MQPSAKLIDPASALNRVFVSSTVRDLESYRHEIGDALQTRLTITADLNERWSGGYDDTLERCKKRVDEAHAFFGIIGFFYGSIPPDSDRSVTHHEFSWALDRWGSLSTPPIAIFMPEGAAAAELQAAAKKLVEEEVAALPPAEQDQARLLHARRIEEFRKEVASPHGQWRTVNSFGDKFILREKAITICCIWRNNLLHSARRSMQPDAARGEPTSEELGSLGRSKQIEALKEALGDLETRGDVPAAAFLVLGEERVGQHELCACISKLRQFRRGPKVASGCPPLVPYELQCFITWFGGALGIRGVDTIEALADALDRALRAQHLAVIVEHLERFPRGVAGFHETFWKPLYSGLVRRLGGKRAARRLVLLAADYSGSAVPPELQSPSPADFSLPIALPQLTPFSRADVARWMSELEIVDEPPGRVQNLIDFVLKGPAGTNDGTPLRVFAELRSETLWPESHP